MKVFFDEWVPRPLRGFLPSHNVQTAQELGWGRLKNGDLIRRAEAENFEVFVTSDQNLRYQQNLSERNIAILILSTNYWHTLRDQSSKVQAAIAEARPKEYRELLF